MRLENGGSKLIAAALALTVGLAIVVATIAVYRYANPTAPQPPSPQATQPEPVVTEPVVIERVVHKMDRRLTDRAAFYRCTAERHDYAENMRYEWKDVTCRRCIELKEHGPTYDDPVVANGE